MSPSEVTLPLDQIPAGRGRLVRIAGRELALFRAGHEAFAIDDTCPHNGSSLSGGRFDGRWVTCPAHGLRFDVRTGCLSGAGGLSVRCHPVRVVDGQAIVRVGDGGEPASSG